MLHLPQGAQGDAREIIRLTLLSILVLLLAACQPIQRESFPDEAAPVAAVAEAPGDEPAATDEASLAGDWEGILSVAGITLRILPTFAEEAGAWSGTISIPQQGASGIPLHTISVDGSTIHFEMLEGAGLGVFEGAVNAEGAIEGTFAQAGQEGTFALTRAVAVEAEPVPYVEEEVTFSHDGITLAGTLTLPEGDGPFPALLLVSGSGPQNRNEELEFVIGYAPFREIAHRLTQEGMAVLRYDDRGVGESTGTYGSATTEDFAADAQAGIAYLRARADIDAAQVGILGHSEGAIVAGMLGASDPDLAFLVSWAGPGVSGYDVVVEQVGQSAAASGADEGEVAEAMATQKSVLDLVLAGDTEALEAAVRAILNEQYDSLDPQVQEALGDKEAAVEQQVALQVNTLLSDWYRFFIEHDPTEDWAQVQVPVLLLFGGVDRQVATDQNMPPLVDALQEAGNQNVTVEVLPTGNHLFQDAVTGAVEEYATLGPALLPEFLDILANWLNETVTYVQ